MKTPAALAFILFISSAVAMPTPPPLTLQLGPSLMDSLPGVIVSGDDRDNKVIKQLVN